MSETLDQIRLTDLLVRGVLGINPQEREKKQDIIVNITLWADIKTAAMSDDIDHTVNYRSVAKLVIEHIETNKPFLVEKLCEDLAVLCFRYDRRVKKTLISVEKPGALRFAKSVGVSIERSRVDFGL